jgi:putative serine protease PepD
MPSSRIVAVIAAAAVVGGGAGAAITTLADDGGSSSSSPALTTSSTAATVANSDLTVGQIAKNTTSSVVEIDATTSSGGSTFPYGGSQSQSAEGTGFVYDTKGDIVTNEHVIDGASNVKVKFSDGSTYTATVVGSDTATDVAIIHVDALASKLKPLTLADSSQVAVGDGVVAIGNPFGLDGTVTSGIISAVGREIASPDDTPIEGAIQTDAAINHGNSGGPLLDLHGQVIGITSQIQSEGGGNDGVGFAVPSNTVKSIATQLISNGKAQHALLGVTPADTANGVRIATVKSGSAADDAGLKEGDVITAVGSTQITTSAQIRAIIAGRQPGDTLALTIRRDGSSKTVHVTLGSRS